MAINIIASYPLIRFAIVEETKCDTPLFFFPIKVFLYLPKQTDLSLQEMSMTSSARPTPPQRH